MTDLAPASAPYSVAVIGLGGVGAYFAARLQQAGVTVHCICRGPHVAAIQRHGLRVTSISGDAVVRPPDAGLPRAEPQPGAYAQRHRVPSGRGPCGLGACCAQGMAADGPGLDAPGASLLQRLAAATARCSLGAVLTRAWQLGERTLVMPTQNGVDAPATLAAVVGAGRVVGGYTRITSLLTEPGCVTHTAIDPAAQGTGVLPSSAPWAAAELRRCAAAWAQSPLLRLVVEADVQLAMWRKLTTMAAYGAVTAAARAPIGPILSTPAARAVLVACMQETAAVGRACGVGVSDADVESALAVLAGLPSGSTPSMQRDLLAGRASELEEQAGAVVRLGGERGVVTPVLGSLYALLALRDGEARGGARLPVMLA